jgi:subtilisin-like proprotein convertase family protein
MGVASLALALCASAGQAQVFSTTPVLPIPATGTLGTVQATLDVSGGPASITDVNVIFDITHTFTGDLDIILVPPSGGVYVHLTSDSGGAGDNFNFIRFDQQAPLSVAFGAAPFSGNFRPEGGDVVWRGAANIPLPGPSIADLSALNGLDSNGTWTLIIDDDAGGDIGTLNYWSMEFNSAIDSQGPAIPGACCLPTGCEVLSTSECAARGGSFLGAYTNCGVVSYAVTTSDAAFESIAGVGTLTSNTNSDDLTQAGVPIGFDFAFDGNTYSTVNISSNGNIQFPPSNSPSLANAPIPTPGVPDAMIAGLWDDLNPGVAGDIFTFLDESGGTGNRKFIVSWENVTQFALTTSESFQIVLFEGSNNFEIRYGSITPEAAPGDYTIGYENTNGSAGVQIPSAEIGSGNTSRLFSFVAPVDPCTSGGGCPACPADFDQDGGVTPADISAFFAEFEAGNTCGDVDLDGGVTPADVGAFFAAFEAGGC